MCRRNELHWRWFGHRYGRNSELCEKYRPTVWIRRPSLATLAGSKNRKDISLATDFGLRESLFFSSLTARTVFPLQTVQHVAPQNGDRVVITDYLRLLRVMYIQQIQQMLRYAEITRHASRWTHYYRQSAKLHNFPYPIIPEVNRWLS